MASSGGAAATATQTAQTARQDVIIKILLVGDHNAGKRDLLLRFCDDTFNAGFVSTIGIDFRIRSVVIEGARCKLQIWDIGGSERFHDACAHYYRGAMAVALVYSIADEQTFDSISSRWLPQVHQVRCEMFCARALLSVFSFVQMLALNLHFSASAPVTHYLRSKHPLPQTRFYSALAVTYPTPPEKSTAPAGSSLQTSTRFPLHQPPPPSPLPPPTPCPRCRFSKFQPKRAPTSTLLSCASPAT